MTGRRSLQTFTERMSRQTQFVPGHVGGRVASAQPVQRRRTAIGAVENLPVEVDYSYLAAVQALRSRSLAEGATTVSLLPSTETPLAAGDVVVTFAIGHNFTWVAPAGWYTLAQGTVVYDGLDSMSYWLGWLRATGSDSYSLSVAGLSGGWTYLGGRYGENVVTSQYYTGVPTAGVVVCGSGTSQVGGTSYTCAAVPPPDWAGVQRLNGHMTVGGGPPSGPYTPNYPTVSAAFVWDAGCISSRYVSLTARGNTSAARTIYDWSDVGHSVPTTTQAFIDIPFGFA